MGESTTLEEMESRIAEIELKLLAGVSSPSENTTIDVSSRLDKLMAQLQMHRQIMLYPPRTKPRQNPND